MTIEIDLWENKIEHEGNWVEGYSAGVGYITFHDYIIGMFGQDHRTVVTDEPVDLSNVLEAKILWRCPTMMVDPVHPYGVHFIVSNEKMENTDVFHDKIYRTATFDWLTDTIDVSGLVGDFYIRVHAVGKGENAETVLEVDRIWIVAVVPLLLKVWDGLSWVTPKAVKHYDGAAWQPVKFVRRWDGVEWVKVWET